LEGWMRRDWRSSQRKISAGEEEPHAGRVLFEAEAEAGGEPVDAFRGSLFAGAEGVEGRTGQMASAPTSAPTLQRDQRAWAALRARLLRCWGVVWAGICQSISRLVLQRNVGRMEWVIPQKATAWCLSPTIPREGEKMPCWNEHGPTAFFWAEIIIDVQGKLGYPSTDTHTPVCFAPINGCL
jgi:hypothetical protein